MSIFTTILNRFSVPSTQPLKVIPIICIDWSKRRWWLQYCLTSSFRCTNKICLLSFSNKLAKECTFYLTVRHYEVQLVNKALHFTRKTLQSMPTPDDSCRLVQGSTRNYCTTANVEVRQAIPAYQYFSTHTVTTKVFQLHL